MNIAQQKKSPELNFEKVNRADALSECSTFWPCQSGGWGVRGTENMSGTSTDALRQLITCAKTLIAETAVAPLCERPLCVCVCLRTI